MLKVGIITGSTRPGRKSPAVAKWVLETARTRTDAEYELVDIKDFELPLLDEPIPLGHAADALCHCLGEVRDLSATMTVRRKSITMAETGEDKPMTADDQVVVTGLLKDGTRHSRFTTAAAFRAAARPRSPRSKSCPYQIKIGGRPRKSPTLPPTSRRRTSISLGTIARERISAPRSKTWSPVSHAERD